MNQMCVILIFFSSIIFTSGSLVLPSANDQCFESFWARYGTFSFPLDTLNSTNSCQWRISAEPNEKIYLKIVDMKTKKSAYCNDSYIEVRDGHWPTSPLLGRFCGRGEINTIISSKNQILVTFHSNNATYEKFAAKYEAICGRELFVKDTLLLKSPNYPKRYPLDKKCIWKIVVPKGNRVGLKFSFFDLESDKNCSFDYVEIRDGPNEDSELIGIYCNQTIPPEILSSTSYLYVKFVSDFSVRKNGFLAAIINDQCSGKAKSSKCKDTCGGILTSNKGRITSPQYPLLYPPNQVCVWKLLVSPEYRIQLNFTHLDIEGKNGNEDDEKCVWDKLEIFSINSENKKESHGIYCGNEKPNSIVSDSNALKIVFQSDYSVGGTGFSLNYSSVPEINKCTINNGNCRNQCVHTIESFGCLCNGTSSNNGRKCEKTPCNYEISMSSGTISSPLYPDYYPLNSNCKWLFTTTPGHRIEIVFDSIDIRTDGPYCSYDNVTLYDGSSSKDLLMKVLCGQQKPGPLTSSKNELFVTFESNYYNYNDRRGFMAEYTSICGGTLHANNRKENYIYSHVDFGLSHYSNNTDCEWLIYSPPGQTINVTFTFFELQEADCNRDYVEIFNTLQSLGKFCGRTLPSTILSQDRLLIKFHTDDIISYRGFSLIYKSEEYVPSY